MEKQICVPKVGPFSLSEEETRVHALALRLSCKQLIPILANYALFSVLLIVLVKFVTSEQS